MDRVYTHESLGPKQSLTPEGFLLCQDVPIARTGMQLYADHELPQLIPGRDGIIKVFRQEQNVFDPTTIASFAGKPVTNDHPDHRVTPRTWKGDSIGVVLNPRRGSGDLNRDFLYADLLLHDESAIRAVRAGKREVSAGYDAEYIQDAPGEATQSNIIGNHVALVDKGRCGLFCAIGDTEMVRRMSFKDRVMSLMRSGDQAAVSEELDKVQNMLGEVMSGDAEPDTTTTGGEGHHITVNVHGRGDDPKPDDPAKRDDDDAGAASSSDDMLQEILARLDAVEQAIVMLANGDDDDDDVGGEEGGEANSVAEPEEGDDENEGAGVTGDARRRRGRTRDEEAGAPDTKNPEQRPSGLSKPDVREGTADRARTTDSTSLRLEFQEALARAEMLVPGIKLPTFDAKQSSKTTFDTLCSFRRNALDEAYRRPESHEYVNAMLGGASPNFAKMTCDTAALVFNGASEIARNNNNRSVGTSKVATRGGGFGQSPTIAEINRRNREHYGIK